MFRGVHFENQEMLLKAEISKMLSLVMQLYKMSVKSIEDNDARLASRVLELDDPIDDLNRQVEESIYELIARYDLIGKQLRYVISMLKFANNLERIGDLASNIAKKTKKIKKMNEKYTPPKELKEMIGISMEMIQDTFNAFGERDTKMAREIYLRDDKVDDYEKKILTLVLEMAKKKEISLEMGQLYTLMARDIERIADHAKNLCDETYYIETGKELSFVLKESKEK